MKIVFYINKIIPFYRMHHWSTLCQVRIIRGGNFYFNSFLTRLFWKIGRMNCWMADISKKCPHCQVSYNEGKKKVSRVSCPRCGYLYCVKCMFFYNGVGGCPKCKRYMKLQNKKAKKYKEIKK